MSTFVTAKELEAEMSTSTTPAPSDPLKPSIQDRPMLRNARRFGLGNLMSVFWTLTEEKSDSDTSSFEGLL